MKTIALPLVAGLHFAGALAAPVSAQDHSAHEAGHMSDSVAVVEVIEGFHSALAAGDSAAVMAVLSTEARILEGGGVETAGEYASHHLPADMAFASAIERDRGPVSVVVRGDVAWATSTSRSTGTYRERDIDSRGAELVVLTRAGGTWRIEAVHWSSR